MKGAKEEVRWRSKKSVKSKNRMWITGLMLTCMFCLHTVPGGVAETETEFTLYKTLYHPQDFATFCNAPLNAHRRSKFWVIIFAYFSAPMQMTLRCILLSDAVRPVGFPLASRPCSSLPRGFNAALFSFGLSSSHFHFSNFSTLGSTNTLQVNQVIIVFFFYWTHTLICIFFSPH